MTASNLVFDGSRPKPRPSSRRLPAVNIRPSDVTTIECREPAETWIIHSPSLSASTSMRVGRPLELSSSLPQSEESPAPKRYVLGMLFKVSTSSWDSGRYHSSPSCRKLRRSPCSKSPRRSRRLAGLAEAQKKTNAIDIIARLIFLLSTIMRWCCCSGRP